MPSPHRPKPGRPHLTRDSQKWVFDYLIKETGKVFHFQPDGRGRFPRSVRSHDMISKHMGLSARRLERLAQTEAEAGHPETAMELYYQATLEYHDAQHVVFETNDEKRFLHGSLMRCYEKVRELAPYRIEHVDIPWNGTVVSGNLHLAPGPDPKPLVFYVPGCDQTKEAWPHPYYNQALQRGMHAFSFDGPGQGEAEYELPIRGDYEAPVKSVVDWVEQRSDLDSTRIGLWGVSLGGYYAPRAAAFEKRIRACIALSGPYDWADIWPGLPDLTREAFRARAKCATQDEARKAGAALSLKGVAEQITCPLFVVAGKLDRLVPWQEGERLARAAKGPVEFCLIEDGNHVANNRAYKYRTQSADWMGRHLGVRWR